MMTLTFLMMMMMKKQLSVLSRVQNHQRYWLIQLYTVCVGSNISISMRRKLPPVRKTCITQKAVKVFQRRDLQF